VSSAECGFVEIADSFGSIGAAVLATAVFKPERQDDLAVSGGVYSSFPGFLEEVILLAGLIDDSNRNNMLFMGPPCFPSDGHLIIKFALAVWLW